MRPFRPRPIQSRGVVAHDGWRLKRWTITSAPSTVAGEELDWPDFAPGRAIAYAALPTPAVTPQRPGVGFIIEHRGNGADYIVLGWWDRENELPVRVVVREHYPGSAWRPSAGSESFCVWDLQVIAFERDAYVATVLTEGAGESAIDAYLARLLQLGA